MNNTFLLKLVQNHCTKRLYSSSTIDPIKKRIAIVGAGPAGFYAAQYIIKHLSDSYVDILEKLPVPFGLVRFNPVFLFIFFVDYL